MSNKNTQRKEEHLNNREHKESRQWKLRSGEASKFEERYAELERKIKHEAETAATAQKPKMTESTTIMQQAERGVVAEVAAARMCEQNTFPHCMHRHRHFVRTSHMMLHAHAWLKMFELCLKYFPHLVICLARHVV